MDLRYSRPYRRRGSASSVPTRFESAVVTCAASVTTANPTEVVLPFNGGILRHFEIVIPAGHSGLTGIALGFGHNSIIPYGALAYYSGDDDIIRRDYGDVTHGVVWSAFLVNGDLQPHVWEVRMDFDEIPNVPHVASEPIAPADIVAAGTQSMAGA